MDIEDYLHTASEIDTFPASIETGETYQQNIQYYEGEKYTYIPIISEGKYYDIRNREIYPIEPEQFIPEDTHLMEVLRRIEEYPFLITHLLQQNSEYIVRNGEYKGTTDHFEIIDKHATILEKEEEIIQPNPDEKYHIWELDKEYLDLANEHIDRPYRERYGIITLADLNKRGLGEMLYPLIAELENQLAKKIQAEYPDDETLVEYLRADTVGR